MKKMAVFASIVFAASLFASGAMAAEEKQQEQEKYGAASEQTERGQVGAEQQKQQEQKEELGQQQRQEGQQQQAAGQQEPKQQKQIQAANELQGFKVQNAQGEQLGEISELLVDIEQGQVGYAVVTAGGVMGMGEQKFIVPFNALKRGEQEDSFTLDIQKEQLKEAPQGDIQQALDRQMGQEIHQFYGVSPYWEEGSQQQQQQQQPQEREQLQQREMQQEQQEQQPGQQQRQER